MSQELVRFEGKQPIVMKGGLVHWVTPETAERFQNQLQTQTSHTFVRLKDANITINTAEVEGVYTMAQYDDLCKVKQGMWQCQYQTWHNLRTVRKMGEEMSRKFGWNTKGPAGLPSNRTCIMCPTKLTGNLRYYCSGGCVAKARERGIYGHEEQHKERSEALATLD